MIPHEKLILIRECCEYVREYWLGNKEKFQLQIWDILCNQTGYDLVNPKSTITR